MKFRSRLTVVGTLLAVALALLLVLPALALDSEVPVTDDGVTLTISVFANDATPGTDEARDTRVLTPGGGATVWVAGDDNAYNQVYVEVEGTGLALTGEGQGVTVRNASTSRELQSLADATKPDSSDRLWSDRPAGTTRYTWVEWQGFNDDDTDSGNGPDGKTLPKNLYRVLTLSQDEKLEIEAATGGSDSFTVVPSSYIKEQEEKKSATFGEDGTTEITEPAPLGTIYFLVAGDNDRIHVTATGSHGTGDTLVNFSVVNSAELKVDATLPAITGTVPANKSVQGRTVAIFGATFTDSGSGLRNDNEDLDYDEGEASTERVVDGDKDQLTTTEPITVREATGTDRGAPADLIITAGIKESDGKTPAKPDGKAAGEAAIFLATNNKLKAATSSWRVVTDGFRVEYTDSNLLPAEKSDVIYFAFGAVDRVGNYKKVENQTLVIDTEAPGMSQAQAGIGYTSKANPGTMTNPTPHEDRHDTPSLRSIKVTFGGGVDGAETLDASSIEKADFRVETGDAVNLPIEEVIHPTLTSSKTVDERTTTTTTNHIVWLVLEDPLTPGARPTVNIVGTILDTAGNRLGAGQGTRSSLRADDETKPEFAVQASASVADRTAATGKVGDRVTITVTSTETLQRTPSIYLVQFGYQADNDATEDVDEAAVIVADVNTPGSVLAAVSGATNTWQITVEGLDDGLWGVFITGDDPENNTGTTGGIRIGEDGRPLRDDVVTDLSKMTLFEIDSSLASLSDDSFVLTPSTNKKTQSRSPFIRINFSEGVEYPFANSTADVQQQVVIDTHDSVTLTKLDIQPAGGEAKDLLDTEGRVDSDSFLVSLSDLAVGKYTLIVNGEDELGNVLGSDYKYNFEVIQRAPYKLNLWPGNNLVSLPGEPEDPSIDAVLPGSHPATSALAYDPTNPVGPWLVATREPGGLWSGPLTEIRAGHGYWVETSAFTPISTRLQERGSGEVPPTFALTAGWNLIGVVAASSDSIGPVSASGYLASVNWSVAYTYDTSKNSWTKVTKTSMEPTAGADKKLGTDDDGTQPSTLKPGQGVWVWLESADVLAP